ncbi:hypothetical protein RMCBS344292_05994 [Rhizopus microsporus]|nr:hypothetical protein RMCBS344292_05994 [Rhizopus microsporus]
MDRQTYSIQQLKVYQAVITSVFRILYPYMPSTVTIIIIQKSFQTRQLRSILPKVHTVILTNANNSDKVRYIQSSMESSMKSSTVVNVVRVSHERDCNQYANTYGRHSLQSTLRAIAIQLGDKMKATTTYCATLTSVAKFCPSKERNLCYYAVTGHALSHRNRANNRR